MRVTTHNLTCDCLGRWFQNLKMKPISMISYIEFFFFFWFSATIPGGRFFQSQYTESLSQYTKVYVVVLY